MKLFKHHTNSLIRSVIESSMIGIHYPNFIVDSPSLNNLKYCWTDTIITFYLIMYSIFQYNLANKPLDVQAFAFILIITITIITKLT